VNRNLSARHEYHVVPSTWHEDFALCPPALAKDPWCADAPGFDRAAFHRPFNTDVLAFFRTYLADQ
jgi:predicted dienelactone hydrolase